MSQGRLSYSPGRPPRPPVYLTGAPRLSDSQGRTISSPRVSGSHRNVFKSGSAYHAFDAPAYCNDMAAYIADQLSRTPKKGSFQDQEIGLSKEDRWRGGASQREPAALADVSVQTTLDDDGHVEVECEDGDGVEHDSDLIDPSRTLRKTAAAQAFLEQIQNQSDDLTETEKGLEEQILSFFGAGSAEQGEEVGEAEEDINVKPEVAAQITDMLAEKTKSSRPLIEEVDGEQEEDGDNTSDEDDESAEETTSQEDSEMSQAEGDVSEDGEQGIEVIPENIWTNEDDEMQKSEQESDTETSPNLMWQGDANDTHLYEDDIAIQSSSGPSQTIELLDSDEEEDHLELVDKEEPSHELAYVMEVGSDGEMEDGQEQVQDVNMDLLDRIVSDQQAEQDVVSSSNLFDQAARAVIEEVWSKGSDEKNALAETNQEAEHQYKESNLFEQPASAMSAFSEANSAPMFAFSSQSETTSPRISQELAASLTGTSFGGVDPISPFLPPSQGSQHVIPPPLSHQMQSATGGADLLSLKQHLNQDRGKGSQAGSLVAQPGTPQRATSMEQVKDAGDGHARHARDLFDIKAAAQNTLDGPQSLSTSIASDLHSAPNPSEVGTVEKASSMAGKPESANHVDSMEPGTTVMYQAGISGDGNDGLQREEDIAAVEEDGRREEDIYANDEVKQTEPDEFEEEIVGYVEMAGSITDDVDIGEQIEVQSIEDGSQISAHMFGRKEGSESVEPVEFESIKEQEEHMKLIEPILEEEEEKVEETEPLPEVATMSTDRLDNNLETAELESVSKDAGGVPVVTSTSSPSAQPPAQVPEKDEEDLLSTFIQIPERESVGVDEEEDKAANEDQEVNIVEEKQSPLPSSDLAKVDLAREEVPREEVASKSPKKGKRMRKSKMEPSSPIMTRRSLRHSVPLADDENTKDSKSDTGIVEEEINEEPTRAISPAPTPKQSKRARKATGESTTNPLITKKSLRRSVSRAASEAASEGKGEERSDNETNEVSDSVAPPKSMPRRGRRQRKSTVELMSPLITKKSLRRSVSRAPSEVDSDVKSEKGPNEGVEKASDHVTPAKSTPRRSRRARTTTVEPMSPLITKKSLRRSSSRAASEATSEGSPRKRRHHRKSDATGDLADFVPDEAVNAAEEDDVSERPAKRVKMEEEQEKEQVVAHDADEDEEMLDTSILEEDPSSMQVDDNVEEEDIKPANEEHDAPKQTRSRRRTLPRKSNDSSFRPRKAEDSESDDDEEAKERKLKKDEQVKKRREEDRERRREQREAKRRDQEAQVKEEKEAERAAAGIVRKRKVSENVKAFRPGKDAAEEDKEEEDGEEAPVPEEETIAKRRSKRRASQAPM